MILIRTNSKKIDFSINSQMSIMSVKITMCKVRSVEANRNVEIKSADIVKNEIKKTKLCTKKSKNLKIVISKIF